MLEINIKRYFKITHIFSSVVWHLPREIFDLVIESPNEVRRLKKSQRVFVEKKAFKFVEKKAFKWEINIRYFKKPQAFGN